MNPPDNLKWRVGFFPIDHAKTSPSYLDWTFEDHEEAQRHAELIAALQDIETSLTGIYNFSHDKTFAVLAEKARAALQKAGVL